MRRGGRDEGSIRKKARARPSPARGRRWLREAESDEGRRGLVGSSPEPSSDLASRGHLLPRVGEGKGGRGVRQSKKARALPSPARGRRWLREAESDEGRRGLVGTSREPSSDP